MALDAVQEHTEADRSMSLESASLQYLNANLLSHGFARSPISLLGLGATQEKNVISVISSLLQQRLDDVKTTEHLSAALQKQQYDVTRLNLQLARVTASQSKLETESSAFKAREAERVRQASELAESNRALREENARVRNALTSVKVNAQHEAKKTQLKLDKAVTQLQKLSSDASLISSPSGIIHLNATKPGQEVAETMGTLLEMSLRDLADIRESLQEETEAFRHVVLGVGNSLRELVALSYGQEVPARLLHSQFFSVASGSTSWQGPRPSQVASSTSHPTLADQRLKELVAQIRARILDPTPVPRATGDTAPALLSLAELEAEGRRIEEMKRRISELEMDLVEAGKREEEGRKLMQEFAANIPVAGTGTGAGDENDVDLLGKRLSEAAELEAVRRQREALERERRRVAQEAFLLEKEREELEAARRAASERQRQPIVERIPDEESPAAEVPAYPSFPMSPNLKAVLERPPAPASPHTPPRAKQHAVGKRRKGPAGPGTPLARMVMAKAVARASSGAGPALGAESGRKTNAQVSAQGASVARTAKKSGWR